MGPEVRVLGPRVKRVINDRFACGSVVLIGRASSGRRVGRSASGWRVVFACEVGLGMGWGDR